MRLAAYERMKRHSRIDFQVSIRRGTWLVLNTAIVGVLHHA